MIAPELSDVEYEKISTLVYDHCGINLHHNKREMVKGRLNKRLIELNFKSFGEYYRYVTANEGTDELVSMIDSLSTNVTFFFREGNHFNVLRQILSQAFKSMDENRRTVPFRIWSAGCSTGEEPYSLAMTASECLNGLPADVKIMATDISTRVLRAAAKGVFHKDKLDKVPNVFLKKYFQVGYGQSENYFRIKNHIRDMVRFLKFNLMDKPPDDYRFDIIFCRNVMIYFDKETQTSLINRFYQCLNNDGYLFIGHAESLTGMRHDFKYIEPSIYRK